MLDDKQNTGTCSVFHEGELAERLNPASCKLLLQPSVHPWISSNASVDCPPIFFVGNWLCLQYYHAIILYLLRQKGKPSGSFGNLRQKKRSGWLRPKEKKSACGRRNTFCYLRWVCSLGRRRRRRVFKGVFLATMRSLILDPGTCPKLTILLIIRGVWKSSAPSPWNNSLFSWVHETLSPSSFFFPFWSY